MDKPFTIVGEMEGVTFADITVPGRGCVELRLDGAIAGMRLLYVEPGCRRLGVGTVLFAEACRVAREKGFIAMSWTVRKTNAEAIAFYRRLGAERFYEDSADWWFGINFEKR